MRVAIVGSSKFDSIEFHIQDELTYQGETAEIFDFEKIIPPKLDLGLSKLSISYLRKKNKRLLNRILDFQPDLVIGVYRFIHPFVIKELKRQGIKVIHINPDALTNLMDQQLFVEPYDAYFTKDPYMKKFMEDKLKLNVFLYNEAFNPRLYNRYSSKDFRELEKKTDIKVLAFGNLYPYRNRMLRILKENRIDLTLYGFKAKYFDEYLNENFRNKGIYGEEKVKKFNEAQIVFNNLHYAEVESVNNKFFEITGYGGFQLCDYTPHLKNILPIDPRRVSFKSIDEAVELIKYYLNKPEERWELRDKLTKYFQEFYTYEKMMESIFNRI